MFFNPTPKRSLAQRTLTVLAALFLLGAAGLFFTACPMEPDDETKEGAELPQKLIGTWKAAYGDFYVLSKTSVSYNEKPGEEYGYGYTGTVEYINEFTETAGVIIIKYDDGGKPTGYTPPGDYIGIYYKEFTAQSVKMGVAAGSPPDYDPVEKATLEEAKAAFTAGKEGDYILNPGTYEHQQ
jgi:hypothetical protein